MAKTPRHKGWRVGNRNPRKRGLWIWQRDAKQAKGCAVLVLGLVSLGATVAWSTWWAVSHLLNVGS